MDFATIGGLLVALTMIVLGAFLEHVKLNSMLGVSAFMIVVGGTIGASMLSHTMEDLKRLPEALKLALVPPKRDWLGSIDYIVGLADKARRSGLLSLQEDADKATNPLVQRGLIMAVDGSDPDIVAETLESMNDLSAAEVLHAAAFLDTAGGYAPTLGIMGTVMGLVTVMGNLAEPDTLGPAIAVAFLATLYGVGFANLVFLPLGAKIKAVVQQQTAFNDMLIQGVIGVQSGANPRNLREKLVIVAGSRAKGAKKGKQDDAKGASRAAEEGA